MRINGKQRYIWRAVDQDGEVIDVYLQAKRDGKAKTESPADKHREMTWAQRLKRVYKIDISIRNRCGSAVKIIASIGAPQVWVANSYFSREFKALRFSLGIRQGQHGKIVALPRVAGLHHRYARVAT